ncbi:MAG: hypothetical protein IPJ43_10380 [Saprospiraceae bacterium]|nr:hypothetical protein [Saprospiraceae bacterium]
MYLLKNLIDLAKEDRLEERLLDKESVGLQIGELVPNGLGVKRYLNCSLRVHKLDSLIGIFGFPTYSLVGYTNVPKAINIILHGPLEYMEKVLPIAQKAYDEGNFDGYELAHLIDRILWLNGKNKYMAHSFISSKIKNLFVSCRRSKEFGEEKKKKWISHQ